MAAEEAKAVRKEAISLRKDLAGMWTREPKGEQLCEKVKQLELQLLEWSIEQDFVQIELEVQKAYMGGRLAEDRQWSVDIYTSFNISQIALWDDHTTRLRGQAFAFHATLNNEIIIKLLSVNLKHFTSVHFQAVQSSLSHD